MNNLRLLAGLLCGTLLSEGVCASGQSIVTLEEIFEVAESHSTQLRPSITAQSEAELDIKAAQSARLPDITANASVSYIGDGFTTGRNLSDYQRAPIPHLGTGLNISVNQPIYTGGAITAAIELAQLKSTASRFAADLKRDNIRFQLTGFYLDIYKYRNLKEVVEANISSARKILDEMTARYEQGTALKNDITRYELLISNLELQLTKIDNTIEILNDNLVSIAGLPAGTVIVPDSTILHRSLPLLDESHWQAEARFNSPVIELARNSVDICKKAESLVRADRLPKIGINAAWTMDGPILVEVPPINRNLSYWYVGVGVSYNLSSLYKTGKTLNARKAATRKAVEELTAASEQVDLEVRAGYIRYLEAYEELKSRHKGVQLAMQNYHTTSIRFSEGMALITDMLDAANSRLEAEQQLINARIDIIYYYHKLLFTSGKI